MSATNYYPDYVPGDATHFRDMLDQFGKAQNKRDLDGLAVLWTLSRDVSRQDIVVALCRIEREKGWHLA